MVEKQPKKIVKCCVKTVTGENRENKNIFLLSLLNVLQPKNHISAIANF